MVVQLLVEQLEANNGGKEADFDICLIFGGLGVHISCGIATTYDSPY